MTLTTPFQKRVKVKCLEKALKEMENLQSKQQCSFTVGSSNSTSSSGSSSGSVSQSLRSSKQTRHLFEMSPNKSMKCSGKGGGNSETQDIQEALDILDSALVDEEIKSERKLIWA